MMDAVTADLRRKEIQEDAKAREESIAIEMSDELAEDWEEEFEETGIIEAIGYQAKEIAECMEMDGLDFEDILKMLAFEHIKAQEK